MYTQKIYVRLSDVAHDDLIEHVSLWLIARAHHVAVAKYQYDRMASAPGPAMQRP